MEYSGYEIFSALPVLGMGCSLHGMGVGLFGLGMG